MTSSDQDVFWGPDFGALQSEDPQIASIIQEISSQEL